MLRTKTLANVTIYLYPTYKPMLCFKILLLETPPQPSPLAVWTCCICFSDETLCPLLACPVPLAPSGGHAATADAFGPHCSLAPPSLWVWLAWHLEFARSLWSFPAWNLESARSLVLSCLALGILPHSLVLPGSSSFVRSSLNY